MNRLTKRFVIAMIAIIGALTFTPHSNAQVGPNRISFGAHVGADKYWGSFTDNQFWLGGDIFLRWNIISQFSLHGQVGLSQLRYKVNEQNILSNPEYFGPIGNGVGTGTYPNTNPAVNREELNTIRVNTYSLLASYNVFPSEKFVPYLFGGIGIMNFEPRNKNQNLGLPNNTNGIYDKTGLVIPFGLGVEWYVVDNLVLNAKGQMHITQTDFLDDYNDGGDNDAFATFGVGFSYYIFGSLDCDEDGLTDDEEKRIGTDPCITDTDKDMLTDFDEVRKYGTDPLKSDTDDDGLNDYEEIMTYATDARKPDTDNDGLKDGDEVARKTNPKDPDTDKDQLTDGDEVNKHSTDPLKLDTDSDGLADGEEINKYSTNPLATDTDNDRLNDGDEVRKYSTDPKNPDSDADALSDYDEVMEHKTDPLKKDTDNDKLTDGEEVNRVKTNPLDPDTDKDTVIDGDDLCPLIRGVVERRGCPEPPKVGTITNFPEIYFIVNTDQFDFTRPQTDENLTKLLQYVKQCPGLGVVIEGHASREGSDTRNQELSDMRAAKVLAWLTERGVDPNKVEATIGYGSRKNAIKEPDPKSAEAKKMDPEALEAIRKQNRRIAVRVVRTCD